MNKEEALDRSNLEESEEDLVSEVSMPEYIVVDEDDVVADNSHESSDRLRKK